MLQVDFDCTRWIPRFLAISRFFRPFSTSSATCGRIPRGVSGERRAADTARAAEQAVFHPAKPDDTARRQATSFPAPRCGGNPAELRLHQTQRLRLPLMPDPQTMVRCRCLPCAVAEPIHHGRRADPTIQQEHRRFQRSGEFKAPSSERPPGEMGLPAVVQQGAKPSTASGCIAVKDGLLPHSLFIPINLVKNIGGSALKL